MTRLELIDLLRAEGHLVEGWGRALDVPFLMVRPGGMVGDRRRLEVWVVNYPSNAISADPDIGMQEMTEAVWGLMRRHLSDVSAGPGPVYVASRGSERLTMVIEGLAGGVGLA